MSIKEIFEQLIAGDLSHLDTFIKEVKNPIITTLDQDMADVTFVYIGDENTDNVVFHSSASGFKYESNQFNHIAGTSVFYKRYEVRCTSEFIYWFSVNDALDNDGLKRQKNIILDPLNPLQFVMKDDPIVPFGSDFIASHCRLPNNPDKYWTTFKPSGELIQQSCASQYLNNERRVWFYQPKGLHDIQNANVLLCIDGNYYVNWFNTCGLIDQMIKEDVIEDTVVIFVSSNNNRTEELTFNRNYCQFILEEIKMQFTEQYGLTDINQKWLICGHSLGGLAALNLMLTFPSTFTKGLLQSAALYWENENEKSWLVDTYTKSNHAHHKVYMTYGIFETGDSPNSIELCNEQLATGLTAMGVMNKLEVYQSGHDYLNWGETLANGLKFLIPKVKTS